MVEAQLRIVALKGSVQARQRDRGDMPTFGWIREDALEAFYEGTERIGGPGPPADPTYRCPFCTTVFSDRRQLQDHVSEAHRVERPALLIGGREPPRRSIVRRHLSANSILVTNATSALCELNGGAAKPIAITEVSQSISKIRQGEVSLVLTNESQTNAAPVATTYEIALRIADAHELKDVERAFAECIMNSNISRESIGAFLADRRSLNGGGEYATGLAEYSLGVLLKERPETEALTTPFSRYREAYGSALQRLSDFDRPLARLICDVLRFAMNDFSTTSSETGFWELDLANALLKDPDARALPSPLDSGVARSPICPVDHGTGQILDLAARMSRQDRWSPILDDECRKIANSEILDANDRQKALAIWAVAAWRLGARHNAIEPLRQISATYPFSSWAEPYLETITT